MEAHSVFSFVCGLFYLPACLWGSCTVFFCNLCEKVILFQNKVFFLFSFFFWLCHAACGILVPWPGTKPVPAAIETQSPNLGPPENSLKIKFKKEKKKQTSHWRCPTAVRHRGTKASRLGAVQDGQGSRGVPSPLFPYPCLSPVIGEAMKEQLWSLLQREESALFTSRLLIQPEEKLLNLPL